MPGRARPRTDGDGSDTGAGPGCPYMFIGMVEQLMETLQRRREQLGISYLHVPFQDIDTFAPVVARLAGT